MRYISCKGTVTLYRDKIKRFWHMKILAYSIMILFNY